MSLSGFISQEDTAWPEGNWGTRNRNRWGNYRVSFKGQLKGRNLQSPAIGMYWIWKQECALKTGYWGKYKTGWLSETVKLVEWFACWEGEKTMLLLPLVWIYLQSLPALEKKLPVYACSKLLESREEDVSSPSGFPDSISHLSPSLERSWPRWPESRVLVTDVVLMPTLILAMLLQNTWVVQGSWVLSIFSQASSHLFPGRAFEL